MDSEAGDSVDRPEGTVRYPDEITVGCSHCVDLEIAKLENLACQLSNEPLASFVDGLAVSLIRQAYFPRLRLGNMDISHAARLPDADLKIVWPDHRKAFFAGVSTDGSQFRHDDGVLNQGVPLRTVIRPAS